MVLSVPLKHVKFILNYVYIIIHSLTCNLQGTRSTDVDSVNCLLFSRFNYSLPSLPLPSPQSHLFTHCSAVPVCAHISVSTGRALSGGTAPSSHGSAPPRLPGSKGAQVGRGGREGEREREREREWERQWGERWREREGERVERKGGQEGGREGGQGCDSKEDCGFAHL